MVLTVWVVWALLASGGDGFPSPALLILWLALLLIGPILWAVFVHYSFRALGTPQGNAAAPCAGRQTGRHALPSKTGTAH